VRPGRAVACSVELGGFKAMQDAGYGDIGANDRAALLRIAKLDPDEASSRLWLSRYDDSPRSITRHPEIWPS
jgi:hypothetical protein